MQPIASQDMTPAAPPLQQTKLSFSSQEDEEGDASIAKAVEKTFLQMFSEMHGDKLAAMRFNDVFNWAVADNETVQGLEEAIEWEFMAFRRVEKKVFKTIDTVTKQTKTARTQPPEESKKEKVGAVGEAASDSQIKLLTENAFRTILETRTDWLALQVMFILFDTHGNDGPSERKHRLQIIESIRDAFTGSTERLSESALAHGHLLMTDMADELESFYNVLPKNMYRKK